MLGKKTITNHFKVYLLSLIILSVLMIYLYREFMYAHDFYFHLNRLITLMDELKNGNFLVYMDYKILDGYGYPIKLFYSDVPLVPFAIIGNIFGNFIGYQSLLFTNNILCAFFSYLAFKKITKNTYAAYTGSLLYTFSAYRLLDIYVRGAVGEVFAFTFLPLVMLGTYEIIYGDYKKWYILAIGFSLLIYSHLISTVLAFVAIVIFLLINIKQIKKEPKRLIYLGVATIICCLICIHYIVPMFEQFTFNILCVQVKELREPIISFDVNSIMSGLFTDYEGIYPSVGLLLLLPLVLRFFIKEKTKELPYIDMITVCGIIAFLFTSDLYPWKIFPFNFLDFIQFSWRLNILATLLLSISCGYYIAIVINKKVATISILSILLSMMVFNSKYYNKLPHNLSELFRYDNYKIGYNYRDKLGISGGEYLPSCMPKPYDKTVYERGNIVIPKKKSTKILDFNKNKGHITFDVEVIDNDNLELPITYYKGYKATLNGQTIEYQQSDIGLIKIAVIRSGKVEVIYVGTTLQRISYYISIISILVLIIFVVIDTRKNKIKEEKK